MEELSVSRMFWRHSTFVQDVFGTFLASPVLVREEKLVAKMVIRASDVPATVLHVEEVDLANQTFQHHQLQVSIVNVY